MAKFEYSGYPAAALAFDASAGEFELIPGFDHQTDRIFIALMGADTEFAGDIGGATPDSQFATVKSADGSSIASGRVRNQAFAEVQLPDGGTVWLEAIDCDGEHLGYLASAPLAAGASFPVLHAFNVIPSDVVAETEEDGVASFGPGTMITTREGDIPVEWLSVEDEVLTRDHGFKPILWIGRERIQASHFIHNPLDCPVEIMAGALGDGQPTHDLYVAADHRILLRSQKAELNFGSSEVFVPAKAWVNNQTISSVRPEQEFQVTRILCHDHEVILAQGSWTESFFTSSEALKTLTIEDRMTIATVLDGPVVAMKTARPTLTQTEAQVILPRFERRSARRAVLR